MSDPSTPERVTTSLTPRGRRALDRLVAAHGSSRSQHVDNGLTLLALVRDEAEHGATLMLVRADGSSERVHVL